MRNLVKYVGMGLLVLGLAACDQKKDEAANDNGVSASQSVQTVTLMDGKLSFSLPPGMSDKSGKLGSQTTNMHVYADETGARAIIVIAGDPTSDGLDVLSKRMEQQQRNRDPQLQVVSNKSVTLKQRSARTAAGYRDFCQQPDLMVFRGSGKSGWQAGDTADYAARR